VEDLYGVVCFNKRAQLVHSTALTKSSNLLCLHQAESLQK
jgi:hypothetical protein